MEKFNGELVFKKQIAFKLFLIVYKIDKTLDYLPGQFLRVEFAPKQARAYSIVSLGQTVPYYVSKHQELPTLIDNNQYVVFLINTKPGGEASKYFEQTRTGDRVSGMGPLGKLNLVGSSREKVFVASGAGVAGFIPMIKELLEKDNQTPVKLFFGVDKIKNAFVYDFLKEFKDKEKYPNFEIYISASKELEETAFCRLGRVTKVVFDTLPKLNDKDFYLCGNPYMIKDMRDLLKDKNIENIYFENHGRI